MPYTGSKAQAGRGTIVSIGGITGAGGSETWTPIMELDSSSFSGGKWATDDTTNFNSGVDQEFLGTIRDNGTVPVKGNRISGDAGQVLLEAAYDDGLNRDFKVQLPINVKAGQTTTGDLYTFSALVESVDVTIETTKKVAISASLKISGPRTLTVGS